MDSSSLSISLPEPLGSFVVTEAKQQGFGTPDEYVQFLLEEQRRKSMARLEAMLDEAIASGPAKEYTPEQWRERQREMISKVQAREAS